MMITVLGILTTIFTAIIAICTIMVWRITSGMEWYASAVESHSNLMLRLEAEKREVELLWWDPTIEPFPFSGRHKEKAELTRIHVGFPPQHRKNRPSRFKRILTGQVG